MFPKELVRRCISAGTSEKGCCSKCGSPWIRIVEKPNMNERPLRGTAKQEGERIHSGFDGYPQSAGQAWQEWRSNNPNKTTGWKPSCKCVHSESDLIPATILDPFGGSGTAGLVAAKMERCAILIELNPKYGDMSMKRIRQELGMLAQVITL